MNRKLLVILSFIIVSVLLLVGCSKGFASNDGNNPLTTQPTVESGQSPVNGPVQSHSGGSVTIDVEWMGVENDSLVFNVAMNTHSVDLDQYDLSELAILTDGDGNKYTAASWDSAPGGHHRRGILYFPVPPSLSRGTAAYIEMAIRNLAGIDERVLRWDLQ